MAHIREFSKKAGVVSYDVRVDGKCVDKDGKADIKAGVKSTLQELYDSRFCNAKPEKGSQGTKATIKIEGEKVTGYVGYDPEKKELYFASVKDKEGKKTIYSVDDLVKKATLNKDKNGVQYLEAAGYVNKPLPAIEEAFKTARANLSDKLAKEGKKPEEITKLLEGSKVEVFTTKGSKTAEPVPSTIVVKDKEGKELFKDTTGKEKQAELKAKEKTQEIER